MARGVACFCLLGLALCAAAQQNPLEPSGFPILSREKPIPVPKEVGQASHELKILSSESWEFKGSEVIGTNVVFEYRGYRVSAKEVLGNLDSQQFALKGDVTAEGKDETLRGESIFVDFSARTFRVAEGGVDVRESFAQGRLLGTLYLNSAEVLGSDRAVTAKHSTLTSCEYPNPHYLLESDYLAIVPNHRLTFRNLRLRVLGKTIFGVPRLVIPLDQRTATVLPDIGNSADEGYYAKFRWGVPVGADNLLGMFDLRSKKGIGLGARYSISRENQRGSLQIYGDGPGSSSQGFTGSLNYRGDLSFGNIEAAQDYRRFSFLTGTDNESSQTRFSFTPRQGSNANSRLSFTQFDSRTGTFHSTNQSTSLTDVRKWSSQLSTNLSVTLNDLQAFSGVQLNRRRAVDVRMHSQYDGGAFLADLDYSRNIPIGSTLNFIGGLDRTPELTVRTDRQLIYGAAAPTWLPNFSLSFAAGNYRDNFNAVDVGRYFLDFRVNNPMRERAGLTLAYDGAFRQGVYSDNSAQYTPAANLHLRYKDRSRIQANLRYNYARQHGFSPIQFDRSGQYNLASFDILAEVAPGLNFGGQVGFDFNRLRLGDIAWVSPSLRLEYKPADWLRFRALANYLPQSNSWSNIRFDLGWKPGGTFVGLTARYDAFQQKWGNVNLYVDALKWGRLKVSTLLLYNGYLARFDTRHFALTYDLHCAEAVLQVLENNTGFRPGREVLLFIRVKALPFDSPFGVGRLGQPLDIGTGVGG